MLPDEIKAQAENIRLSFRSLLSRQEAQGKWSVEHAPCCCDGRCDLLHLKVVIENAGHSRVLVMYSSSERLRERNGSLDWLVIEEHGTDVWCGSTLEQAAKFLLSHTANINES